jgi:hypothetical protein
LLIETASLVASVAPQKLKTLFELSKAHEYPPTCMALMDPPYEFEASAETADI